MRLLVVLGCLLLVACSSGLGDGPVTTSPPKKAPLVAPVEPWSEDDEEDIALVSQEILVTLPEGLADIEPANELAERCLEVLPLLEEAAVAYELDIGLLAALTRCESSFKPEAESKAGAMGLMQIMPITKKHFGCGDLFEADENVACGAQVLKYYLDKFDGNWVYGLAAYNSGAGNVKGYVKAQALPKNFKYYQKILKYRARFLKHGCNF